MNRIKGLLMVALVLAIAGCATVPSRSSPDNGAIYGYFDIPKDSYGALQSMSFFQYPPVVKAYLGNATDIQYIIVDGAFFAFDAAPGQYFLQMVTSHTYGFFGGETRYQFELIPMKAFDIEANKAEVQKHLITVKPGELVFIGAQQITEEKKPGFFSFQSGKFSIGPVNSPTEKEVLLKLQPALKDTPWEKVVADKIATLK